MERHDDAVVTPVQKNESIRDRYVPMMAPVFFPDDPTNPDIIQLFASLLRIVGIEDRGWDPYMESRGVLEDLYALTQLDLPEEKFKDQKLTIWRLGLLFYSHIVEMSAPYEVLTNLLRFRLGYGYSPNPYYDFLAKKDRKKYKSSGIYPKKKIEIIKQLSDKAGLKVGDVFDEFYSNDFRNAIAHSDFILSDNGFCSRNGNLTGAFELTFERIDNLITRAKVFIAIFFELEREARRIWGQHAGKGIAYDSTYKGIMEVLVDGAGLMNGFKVHWPNCSDSMYRRTTGCIEVVNCSFATEQKTLNLFVGPYARNRSTFSPLVEDGATPLYSPLENGVAPIWNPSWCPSNPNNAKPRCP